MTKISTVIALMLSGLTAVAPLTGQAQACQQGVVYLDRDGNGRRGSDEAGMPGIRVSNVVNAPGIVGYIFASTPCTPASTAPCETS